VQAVTSTIPNYNMQTAILPKSICKDIDKINRDFLWGDTIDKKKTHLVKWEKVCRPKKFGGLGLRTCENNNLASIAKIGWNLVSKKESLWTNVLKQKYKIPVNPNNWKSKGLASHIWRGGFKTKSFFQKGIKWNVGNGENISLWSDWWTGKMRLQERLGSDDLNFSDCKVKEIISPSGGWDEGKISRLFPINIQHNILSTPLPMGARLEDTPT